MLLDLTPLHLKRFVGLAWSPDSKRVTFLNDAARYDIDATGGPTTPSKRPLPGCPSLAAVPDMSATRNPALGPADTLTYNALTPTGPHVVEDAHDAKALGALTPSPDGTQLAVLPPPAILFILSRAACGAPSNSVGDGPSSASAASPPSAGPPTANISPTPSANGPSRTNCSTSTRPPATATNCPSAPAAPAGTGGYDAPLSWSNNLWY